MHASCGLKAFVDYSENLQFICNGGDLEQIGRTPYPSEGYILKTRHLIKEEHLYPWNWDWDYPEDMRRKQEMYPEVVNALVQIDIALDKKEQNNVHPDQNSGIG